MAVQTLGPRNAWYAAAWSNEITRALASRTICGQDVLLYRRADGGLAALEDACWHRLVPLSLGRLVGDDVVCGYHGLAFNPAGRCVHMPAQKTINPSACVPAFPVAEKHGLIWIWTGNPALADPAKIPDFHWNNDPALAGEGGTYYGLKCEYRLVIDNLMDLTHETYVHAGSIGDESVTSSPFDVTHAGHTATVTRWMRNIEPAPFWGKQLGKPGLVDRWQIIRFESPGIVIGDVGVAPVGTGAPQGDRSQGVGGFFLAAITPQSETTCSYFWNFVRSFRTDDADLTHAIRQAHNNAQGTGLYDQDRAILEAQQAAIERHPRALFYNLNIDGGALWARRLIEQMQAEEAGVAAVCAA